MGHTVETSVTTRDGLQVLEREPAELLILDLRIGDGNGLDVIRECRRRFPETAVVVVTGYGCVASAVEAMKLGSFDYLTKPFSLEEFCETVRRALMQSSCTGSVAATVSDATPGQLVARSDRMQKVAKLVPRIADSRSPVLLEGEFGTGKRLIARAIHHAGARRGCPLRVLPCGSLPEAAVEHELFGPDGATIFQRADRGTVVIEDIHLLSPRLQSRLEAWLEGWDAGGPEIPVDGMSCRLIATSALPLDDLVRSGRFREDLYYRLSMIPVSLPPLRERREDILPLALHFLRQCAEVVGSPARGIDPAAAEILSKYRWPGNVSELRNAMERAGSFAEGKVVLPDDLPPRLIRRQDPAADAARELQSLPIGCRLSDFVRRQERLFIWETMKFNAGSREKTASMLGVSMATLYRKIGMRVGRNREPGREPGAEDARPVFPASQPAVRRGRRPGKPRGLPEQNSEPAADLHRNGNGIPIPAISHPSDGPRSH